MRQYLELLKRCCAEGERQKNRTGIDTLMIPGGMMQFDLERGFPILTTKKVNFAAVVAELLGFIHGVDNAKDFRALGTTIWDANANQNEQWLKNPNRRGEDDLGRIYGTQWRDWPGRAVSMERPGGVSMAMQERIDQLRNALDLIEHDPTSRRIIVTAWNPAELNKMALPPCHLLYQFLVSQQSQKLNLCMYMRSCDMFLGVPFNISSYALLLSLVARATNLNVGTLTMFLADCHVYVNHLEQVHEQVLRPARSLPMLGLVGAGSPESLGEPTKWLENIRPSDIRLIGYDPHPPIKAEMAV